MGQSDAGTQTQEEIIKKKKSLAIHIIVECGFTVRPTGTMVALRPIIKNEKIIEPRMEVYSMIQGNTTNKTTNDLREAVFTTFTLWEKAWRKQRLSDIKAAKQLGTDISDISTSPSEKYYSVPENMIGPYVDVFDIIVEYQPVVSPHSFGYISDSSFRFDTDDNSINHRVPGLAGIGNDICSRAASFLEQIESKDTYRHRYFTKLLGLSDG